MLWQQRLGHISFRRLSEMHRFVKGIPQFKLPTELEECPICLAAKLCKTPKGTETTIRATACNQGLSINFGFMVQKSRNSVRHNTLVGLNGETCNVLLTDHFSGRVFRSAFAMKAPPVDWINSWLARNSPQCSDKYFRMDGGGELGKCRDIHRTFANFGYAMELTGPDSSTEIDLGNVRIRRSAMLFAPCFPVRTSNQTSGRTRSTITSVSTILSLMAIDLQARTRCVVLRFQILRSSERLGAASTFAQRLLDMAALFPTPASGFSSDTRAPC
jgi:hypothetical protein